jgi:glycosyltransferase involved in cell wall biosynthesis
LTTRTGLSVVLCTYNPDRTRLQRTIDALAAQTLPRNQWELLIVDNASQAPVADAGYNVPVNARFIEEPKAGLVHARIAGIQEAAGTVIVFCDDDNVLDRDYLANATEIMSSHPELGVAAGKSRPEFEIEPEDWMNEFYGSLALYDHGDEIKIAAGTDEGYPSFVGGGCGAVFRRKALDTFLRHFEASENVITGRRGSDLSSGEDNDIVLHVLEAGWQGGYFPQLVLLHLIAAQRLDRDYLARLNEGIAKSWVQVLSRHGLCPWAPTSSALTPLRIFRAYLRYRAWKGPAEYVRWRGACGQFRGRAEMGSITPMSHNLACSSTKATQG